MNRYPLGATRLKRKLLHLATRRHSPYTRCVYVPYWMWDATRKGGEGEGEEFLRQQKYMRYILRLDLNETRNSI